MNTDFVTSGSFTNNFCSENEPQGLANYRNSKVKNGQDFRLFFYSCIISSFNSLFISINALDDKGEGKCYGN